LKATHLIYLQDQLWNLIKEKVEEEGECEDGTQVRVLERKEDTAVLKEWAMGIEFSFRLKGNTRNI
jgi:hypothetical protein